MYLCINLPLPTVQRQEAVDPQTDWTNTLLQFMIHQIRELLRTNAANQSKSHQALTYLIRLISWNYHEGLLNCELFLTKMVDLLHDTTPLT